MQQLTINIAAWIIQDGNYADFRVGAAARFAIEFHPVDLQPCDDGAARCEPVERSEYCVTAQVVHADKSAWAIDFGLRAYQSRAAPRIAAKGQWLAGVIELGVDPFFYRDELHRRTGMPAMLYDWRIKAILLETTPWQRSTNAAGQTVLTRDGSQRSFIEVAETNAWEDDDGRATYLLRCERLDG